MSESLFALANQQLCEHLLAIRRSREWQKEAVTFEVYAKKRWSLSKTRVKLLCNFATFCNMARESYLPLPDSPENIAPLLGLPQKRWMDVWQMYRQFATGPTTASSCQAFLDHFGQGKRKKIPLHVLHGKQVRKAAETLASLGDGEALVEEIGPKGLGSKWDEAVRTVIDADQARMNKLGAA